MRITVTEQGVLIPKNWLPDVSTRLPCDPIQGLGVNPVACGRADGSEHHDQYLYDGAAT
jgi:hypothetical protein